MNQRHGLQTVDRPQNVPTAGARTPAPMEHQINRLASNTEQLISLILSTENTLKTPNEAGYGTGVHNASGTVSEQINYIADAISACCEKMASINEQLRLELGDIKILK